MRLQARIALAAVAILFAAPPMVDAQPMAGGGGMPNLADIVGKPLPDRGMATGMVSVRVARKAPANPVANVEVTAIIRNAGGDLRKRTAKTDESGRALFEGMTPGDQFTAEVTVDGEKLKTDTFDMPQMGGVRTMLISAVPKGGGMPAPGRPPAAGGAQDQQDEAPPAPGEPPPFALGATAGTVVPDTALPSGTLEVKLLDENGAPIPNHHVSLGLVGKGKAIDVKRGRSDAAGLARFTDLTSGTVGAAVMEWRGLRLGTVPFAMPDSGGARAEIRALARTADPSAVNIGAGGRIVFQMMQDALVVLEFLPLENNSDKMFDPSPGAIEIPLPSGHVGAQVKEGDRKLEVRKDHGIAVHGPIVPQRSIIASGDKTAVQEVVFQFVLPYRGDSHDFEQKMPNGIGPSTLIIDQKLANLTASGPGVGAREERSLGGKKYWVMPVEAVAPGGTLRFTLTGLPSTPSGGRIFAGVLSVLLVISTVVFGRKPGRPVVGKHKTATDERTRLIGMRESLFSELVALEREAREAGTAAPEERRKPLVTRLEQVYRDLAALDEHRAA
jgi:hypothetical protein